MTFTNQSYGNGTCHKGCSNTHRVSDPERTILCCIQKKAASLIGIDAYDERVCHCGSVAIGLTQAYHYDDKKLIPVMLMLADLKQDMQRTDAGENTRYYKTLTAIGRYIVMKADSAYNEWLNEVDDLIAALSTN